MSSYTLTYVAGFLLLVLLCFVSMTTGVADFHWMQLWQQPDYANLLFTSRIPRTAAIVLTGATLAVAGMVMQIVLRNRFIEPSMVGATQSAALGMLAITLLLPAALPAVKMGASALAALAGMSVFLLLLRRLPPHKQLLIPLAGIVYGNIIDSVASFVAIETDTVQMLSAWNAGDFSTVLAGRYELLWLTAVMAVAMYILADRLTIAGLGKNISTGLGVNHARMLWTALLTVSVITAIVVATVGQIPFIGLVVPNIVSRLAGDRLRRNLPAVALLGADALLACDIVGRTVNAPYEIPVSLVFGLAGTAVFLYLLFAKRTRYAA